MKNKKENINQEIVISIITKNLIDHMKTEMKLNDEQVKRLNEIAIEDITKLYN